MKKTVITLLCLICNWGVFAQISGNELLDRAIEYHDPDNNWDTFSGTLNIALALADGSTRTSSITLDIPNSYFKILSYQDSIQITREIKEGNCGFLINGVKEVSETDLKKYRGSCQTTKMYKNYYSYLYGLPMKLKDKGAIINPVVETAIFKGKTYYVLSVTYDKHVGTDRWKFYFNTSTYAMEVYQFFKDSTDKTGEYILLTDEVEISGIKMPKNRAWYYNKDNKYLGTDRLMLN